MLRRRMACALPDCANCQQAALCAVAVLGGEAAFTGLTTDANTPGRPTVPATMGGVVGTLAVRCGLPPTCGARQWPMLVSLQDFMRCAGGIGAAGRLRWPPHA